MSKSTRSTSHRSRSHAPPESSAAGAAAASAGAAAAPALRRDRSTTAAAAASSRLAATPTNNLKPIVLQRQDWYLTEESRQQPLSECFSYNDFPFLWSCASGNLSDVRRLLAEEQVEQQRAELRRLSARGAAADTSDQVVEETFLQQCDSHGWTGLHWAAAFGHEDILAVLFDAFLETLPPPPTTRGYSDPTSLRYDCTASFLTPVYLFVNRTTQYLDTPLHLAAYNCHVGAMRWLVSHGGDIRARNNDGHPTQLGQTPLMCIVEKKCRRETRARQATACLWMARHIREVEDREWLSDDDEASQDTDTDTEGRSMKRRNAQEMDRQGAYMVPTYRMPPDMAPSSIHGESQAKTESQTDDIATAASMTDIGTDTIATTVSQANSPVKTELGSTQDASTTLGFSVAASPLPSPSPSPSPSTTALAFPAPLFPLLSSINDRRDSGSTSLMMAAFGGNYAVVLALLQHGALVDLDLHDVHGQPVRDSALLNAIDEGHLSVTRLLLQWGADRFVRNLAQETAALVVCSSGQECFRRDEQLRLAFLQLLFDEGVDSASAPAVRAHYLVERDSFGATPFIWAARLGCMSVVRFLVERGCDVDVVDPTSGETVVRQLCKRIQKSRMMRRNTGAAYGGVDRARKKAEHARLCEMLLFFTAHERCATQASEVPEEVKQYAQDTVRAAEESVAAMAATTQAAEAARKRHRSASAASLPPGGPTVSLRPIKKKVKLEPEEASKAASLPSPPPPKSKLINKKSMLLTRTRSGRFAAAPAPAAPARFFKGGRQKNPDLVQAAANARPRARADGQTRGGPPRGGSTRDSAANRPSMLDSSDDDDDDEEEEEEEGEQKDAPIARSDEDEEDDEDVADEESSNASSESSVDLSSAAAPAPVPAPRIQGTIGAKLTSHLQQQPQSQSQQLMDLTLDATVADSTLLSALNGELSHECQVDDTMLIDQHVEAHQLDQHAHEEDPPHLHAFETTTDDHMHDDTNDPSSYRLSSSSSPLKYASSGGSASHLFHDTVTKEESPGPLTLGSPGIHPLMMPPASQASIGPFRVDDALLPSSPLRHSTSSLASDLESTPPNQIGGSASASRHHLPPESSQLTANESEGRSTDSSFALTSVAAAPVSSAATDDAYGEVRAHLISLGLVAYIPRFIENEMNFSQWATLAEENNQDLLKELIRPAGHRLIFRTFVRERFKTD